LKKGLLEQGFTYASDPEHSLPMLNLVNIPEGIENEAAMRRHLLDEFNLEIGGGLGKLAGKCWRVGLMGHGAHESNVNDILHAFSQTLAVQA